MSTKQNAAVSSSGNFQNLQISSVSDTVKALFVVTGPSDPGLLPRIIEPVSKLGHVPSRVHASCESGDGSEMTVDLRLSEVPARVAEQVENALRAIIGVRQVFAVIESAR